MRLMFKFERVSCQTGKDFVSAKLSATLRKRIEDVD